MSFVRCHLSDVICQMSFVRCRLSDALGSHSEAYGALGSPIER
jgi:hypothetical protein